MAEGFARAAAVVAQAAIVAVKPATGIPRMAKRAPTVPNIGEIAVAVVEAGAAAITAVNTMPGMLSDAESVLPVHANRTDGVSGPALKPIALRCVYEIAGAVRVPIIGTGGVITATDALEMLMAGATAVAIGSAVCRYSGAGAFGLIVAVEDPSLLLLTYHDGLRHAGRGYRAEVMVHHADAEIDAVAEHVDAELDFVEGIFPNMDHAPICRLPSSP